MTTLLRMALLALILVLPMAFADVGPSPAPPKVTVYLVKDGSPAAGVSEMTYHCTAGEVSETASAVEPYPINLTCSGGTCTNDNGWYYKFNPCFSFPGGYFTYVFDGNNVQTENFSVGGCSSGCVVTVDAPTGQIESIRVSETPGICTPALVLGALLGAALLRRP